MKEYNVGDSIWWARCETRQIKKPCPVCFGKKEATLILGNGDEVILPCEYCGYGINAPTGIITGYEYVAEPEHSVITKVKIEVTDDGEERKYYIGHCDSDGSDIFDSEAEALAKCTEMAQKREHEQMTLAEHIKENKQKSFLWNAGYHLEAARKSREEAARHERNAVLCTGRTVRQKEVKSDTGKSN